MADRSRHSLGKRLPPGSAGSRLVVLNGQPFSSLGTPPFQDETSGRRLHTMAKAVLLGALSIVWLKGPQWHLSLAPSKTTNLTLRY